MFEGSNYQHKFAAGRKKYLFYFDVEISL